MGLTKIRGNTQIMAETILDAQINPNAGIKTTKLLQGLEFVQRDGSVPFIADVDMGGFRVTNAGNATSATDLVTKAQLDGAIQGLTLKRPVRAATTAPVDLINGGLVVIDDVILVEGDRVLVKNQIDATENGIYVASSGAWVRSADADNSAGADSELSTNAYCMVSEGTKYQDQGWFIVTDGVIDLGITPLEWEQFTGLGQVVAGLGLYKDGNVLHIGTNDGIAILDDSITVKLDGTSLFKSVAGLKINTSGVQTAHLANDSVTKDKLNLDVAGAGLEQLIDGSLGVVVDDSTLEIAGDTVRVRDYGVTLAKLQSLGAGRIILGNVAGDAKAVAMQGDVIINDTGVTTITLDVILFENMINRQVPSGAIDGVNKVFILANIVRPNSEHVYWNGSLLEPGPTNDYVISGNTLTLTFSPEIGDKVLVSYIK